MLDPVDRWRRSPKAARRGSIYVLWSVTGRCADDITVGAIITSHLVNTGAQELQNRQMMRIAFWLRIWVE